MAYAPYAWRLAPVCKPDFPSTTQSACGRILLRTINASSMRTLKNGSGTAVMAST